eukprot:TRINITY_DN30850_c0_g1_i1.p1 TRINITY_DN30850_c0_g1~~TRINITY_DN30850_c0_g1_i1.p1  ORF type:complete len:226 (+),score=18.07 TRINITY_DN30850_c0_g1_i1:61-738(+)
MGQSAVLEDEPVVLGQGRLFLNIVPLRQQEPTVLVKTRKKKQRPTARTRVAPRRPNNDATFDWLVGLAVREPLHLVKWGVVGAVLSVVVSAVQTHPKRVVEGRKTFTGWRVVKNTPNSLSLSLGSITSPNSTLQKPKRLFHLAPRSVVAPHPPPSAFGTIAHPVPPPCPRWFQSSSIQYLGEGSLLRPTPQTPPGDGPPAAQRKLYIKNNTSVMVRTARGVIKCL